MGRTGSGVEARKHSIRLSFTDGGGQPQRRTLTLNGAPLAPTPANLKYAHRLAAEIRDRVRHGTFSMAEYFPAAGSSANTLTVAVHLRAWLSTLRLADSTLAGYRSVVDFWSAAPCDDAGCALGDLHLRALKPSHIKAAIARTQLSGKTVNNRVSVLRMALAAAGEDKLLPDNPAATVKSAAWQRHDVDPFSHDEAERVIAAMPAGQVRNYTEFKFYTGLRSGESFGLRWANVDLASGRVVIKESVVRGKEKASTKTDTVRTVILNSRAMASLKAQKAYTYLAGEHVFCDPRDGKRWGGEPRFRHFWVPTLKRLGIRHRPQYNTRHTYATAMLMAGMTPAFCAKQLGHSVEVFLRAYSKWLDGAQDAVEMQRFERSLGADSSPVLPQTAAPR